MKKLSEMTVAELQAYRREQCDNISAIDAKVDAEKREMSADEKAERAKCIRKFEDANREIMSRNQDEQHRQLEAKREVKVDCNAQLREILKDARSGNHAREITLDYKNSGANTAVVDSGAVALTIHDIVPTLNEGLGLPAGVNIVTGVTGNSVWPVSVDDAELQEVGETEALKDQNLDFSKVQAVPGRIGLTISVSNTAIDNAAFDLMGFVQQKFTLALKKFLAKKVYSQAAFAGIHGPFKSLSPAGTITLDNTAYKGILEAVAKFADKGISSDKVCLIMDATTEAQLKAAQKGANTAGYIIEDGKCAGYNYVVSHYVNTTLGSGANAGKLVATPDRYLGIGCFDYLAVQFHGKERLSIDATSKTVAIKNVTAITLNAEVSVTEIQPYSGGIAVKAFALYKVAEPSEEGD